MTFAAVFSQGFAEYVSAYSMIQVGITSFVRQIELQKLDGDDNFTYRSGAIGGLYLTKRLRVMPFENNEDHRESVWEIILRLQEIDPSPQTLEAIHTKYLSVTDVDGENEVKRVVDYLVSIVAIVQNISAVVPNCRILGGVARSGCI